MTHKKHVNRFTIFITSFVQVGLVAVNTIILQKGYIFGIFMVSFTISLIWSINVSKIALSKTIEKLIYSLGAGIGSVCGYYITNILLN